MNQSQYQRQQYIRYNNPENNIIYQEPNIKSNYQNYQNSNIQIKIEITK